MRIVGGQWRGRLIRVPKGQATRPTADRVREALFSSLEARYGSLDGMRVLDAFAGSGALGFEALSRGAAHAVFFESDVRASTVLAQNASSLGALDRARIVTSDVFRHASAPLGGAPVSLLLLDPPYRIDKVEVKALIEGLRRTGSLSTDAVFVWEHASGEPALWPEGVTRVATRRYGSTEIEIAEAGMEEER